MAEDFILQMSWSENDAGNETKKVVDIIINYYESFTCCHQKKLFFIAAYVY